MQKGARRILMVPPVCHLLCMCRWVVLLLSAVSAACATPTTYTMSRTHAPSWGPACRGQSSWRSKCTAAAGEERQKPATRKYSTNKLRPCCVALGRWAARQGNLSSCQAVTSTRQVVSVTCACAFDRDLDNEDDLLFGVHEEMLYARNSAPVPGAQWTGIVTQIAIDMLESGAVDAVVCVQSQDGDRFAPKPVHNLALQPTKTSRLRQCVVDCSAADRPEATIRYMR